MSRGSADDEESKAVIKGYSDERIQGRQCKRNYFQDSEGNWVFLGPNTYQCCVLGAAAIGLGMGGDPAEAVAGLRLAFEKKVGIDPADLNNEGMDWRDIVGIAIAEGL